VFGLRVIFLSLCVEAPHCSWLGLHSKSVNPPINDPVKPSLLSTCTSLTNWNFLLLLLWFYLQDFFFVREYDNSRKTKYPVSHGVLSMMDVVNNFLLGY